MRSCLLADNIAVDGAVVYGMGNEVVDISSVNLLYIDIRKKDGTGLRPSLVFYQSRIENNWAKQNLIHILLSQMGIN